RAVRDQLLHRLHGRCASVQHVQGGADALAKLEMGGWEVLFLDRALPDLDADELRCIVGQRFPGIRVVVLDPESAESSARAPESVMGECPRREPRWRPPLPGMANSPTNPLPGMIGVSEAMQRIYHLVRLVAGRTTTVLIAGPTGTGKELVARALHR